MFFFDIYALYNYIKTVRKKVHFVTILNTTIQQIVLFRIESKWTFFHTVNNVKLYKTLWVDFIIINFIFCFGIWEQSIVKFV